MSATPFADQRTTAGGTASLSSRIIYHFCFCKPLCIPSVSMGVRRVPCHEAPIQRVSQGYYRRTLEKSKKDTMYFEVEHNRIDYSNQLINYFTHSSLRSVGGIFKLY